jgi:hypothetical protein
VQTSASVVAKLQQLDSLIGLFNQHLAVLSSFCPVVFLGLLNQHLAIFSSFLSYCILVSLLAVAC